jgi:hypothetical protein|nr:MAG TPA: hypothetical protein [Caudoviricetes sp.]
MTYKEFSKSLNDTQREFLEERLNEIKERERIDNWLHSKPIEIEVDWW